MMVFLSIFGLPERGRSVGWVCSQFNVGLYLLL